MEDHTPYRWCETCRRPLVARAWHNIYCSRPCREWWKNRTPARREAKRRYDAKPKVWKRKNAARLIKDRSHRCDECGGGMLVSHSQLRQNKTFRCDDCKAPRSEVPWAECEWCGKWFVGRRGKKLCGSPTCAHASKPGTLRSTDIGYGDCEQCGATFVRRAGRMGAYCSRRCQRHAHKRARAHRKRTNGPGEMFTLREIAERDGWRCHICHKRVPDREYRARPDDPTIDHLIPVSDGGLHVRANVALAHNRCNYERCTGGVAQLLLVG